MRKTSWNYQSVCTLVVQEPLWYCLGMSMLAQIEAAAEALAPEQKLELPLFAVARLLASAEPLEGRKFTREQIASWIA